MNNRLYSQQMKTQKFYKTFLEDIKFNGLSMEEMDTALTRVI